MEQRQMSQPWKCVCGITLGIDDVGYEFQDLDNSKYAPLFRSVGVPAAYMYEAGEFLPADTLRMPREEFTRLIARDVGVTDEDDSTNGVIISNGWTWRYVYASKVKEIEEHVLECRNKKRRKDEIQECMSEDFLHGVRSKWVYEDGAIQHKHSCRCGREWFERIE